MVVVLPAPVYPTKNTMSLSATTSYPALCFYVPMRKRRAKHEKSVERK